LVQLVGGETLPFLSLQLLSVVSFSIYIPMTGPASLGFKVFQGLHATVSHKTCLTLQECCSRFETFYLAKHTGLLACFAVETMGHQARYQWARL
jgi:hypothetical protein